MSLTQRHDISQKQLTKNKTEYIILGMGELGKETRIYFGKGYEDRERWGSLLSYFPEKKEEATAPRQITFREYFEHHNKLV